MNLFLRWPDTIYLHIGRLFPIQVFDHSAAFDCRDILDTEKEMLEVSPSLSIQGLQGTGISPQLT